MKILNSKARSRGVTKRIKRGTQKSVCSLAGKAVEVWVKGCPLKGIAICNICHILFPENSTTLLFW